MIVPNQSARQPTEVSTASKTTPITQKYGPVIIALVVVACTAVVIIYFATQNKDSPEETGTGTGTGTGTSTDFTGKWLFSPSGYTVTLTKDTNGAYRDADLNITLTGSGMNVTVVDDDGKSNPGSVMNSNTIDFGQDYRLPQGGTIPIRMYRQLQFLGSFRGLSIKHYTGQDPDVEGDIQLYKIHDGYAMTAITPDFPSAIVVTFTLKNGVLTAPGWTMSIASDTAATFTTNKGMYTNTHTKT